ncbi:hypothetical protein TNCV_462001 [Trichonephila clavipes]|uniref:Uncharacterized protein n=1 Tax=Trichonephila clavipes TaxID=2585209 RepID=A0A8X6RA17_TRICX|nr:hypothetical protein TNCV_462001 [Trichonephila clavipes]
MHVLSPKQQNVMKQLKDIKEKGERDNYWKTIVADLTTERDVFKNESKENEWKVKIDALKSERDTLKAERDNLLLENCGLRRILIHVTQMFSDLFQK